MKSHIWIQKILRQVMMIAAIAMTFAVNVFTQTPNTAWYTSNPGAYSFTISTADQLAGLAQLVNNGNDFYDKIIYLSGNIDLSAYGVNWNYGWGWTPIGNEYRPFRGYFDGTYGKITNLYMDGGNGLFGYIDGGSVKYLTIEGANINSFNSSGTSYTGSVVGYNNGGTLEGCDSSGSVIVEGLDNQYTHSTDYAGGIAGGNSGLILWCHSTCSVTSYNGALSCAGGVVGYNDGNGSYSGEVRGCSSSGIIVSGDYAGGIVGENYNFAQVGSCYSTGSVSALICGGIVGANSSYSDVSTCLSTCSVGGSNTSCAGGMVGSNGNGARLMSCVALNPSITCQGSSAGFGRIVGANNSYIWSNKAFVNMLNPNGGTTWNNIGEGAKDGENITVRDINEGTCFDSFYASPYANWQKQVGMLPGLGEPIDIPEYLKKINITSSVDYGNGTITPSETNTVNYNESKTYTITPNTGYHIDKVLVDGVNNPTAVLTGSYTFTNITDIHTIVASFVINTYTITASVNDDNGTITPSGTATINHGGNSQTYTFTPNPGYHIDEILIDGINNSIAVTSGSYIFTGVSGNHTIVASFAINTNTIVATVNGDGGTISPPGVTTVNYGESQTYTITPNTGYHIRQVWLTTQIILQQH